MDPRAILRRMVRDAKAMGLPVGRMAENENPTVGWLAETCQRLGLDFANVCRRAYDVGPVAAFVTDASLVEARFGRPYVLDGIGERIRALPGVESGEAPELAEQLDNLRYRDPRQAARQAKRALREANGPLTIAQILGVLGSAHRTLYRLDWSTVELGLAISLAEIAGSDETVAQLAQRAACVLLDRGLPDQGEALIREALATYCRLADEEGDSKMSRRSRYDVEQAGFAANQPPPLRDCVGTWTEVKEESVWPAPERGDRQACAR